jgi:hypothetical protein
MSVAEDLAHPSGETPTEASRLSFGVENRTRLLDTYLAGAGEIGPDEVWKHVYRLLLWRDRRTGLAHCYESDKCQPGRPWYARSLRFHDWLADQLGVEPSRLPDALDWLFTQASEDMARLVAANRPAVATAAAEQRKPYAGRGLPEPWEDAELIALLTDALGGWLRETPPAEVMRQLVEDVTTHLMKENKRKNLLGEGFEDTLAAILRRVPEIDSAYDIRVRAVLHDLPGFHPPRRNKKTRQVDLALIRRRDSHRTLVTSKWSVRSDREEQFTADYGDYVQLEALGETFDHVLVTNEFDAARLVKACENIQDNAPLFSDVVHVNPGGPQVTYSDSPHNRNVAKMRDHIERGRLASLAGWLDKLATSGDR